jgi:hypothetical protein
MVVGKYMFSKNRYSLLIRYIFVYPMYYVFAMTIATLLLAVLMGWSVEAAKRFFFVAASVMWVTCYVIHLRILFDAINNLRYQK